MLMIQTGNWIPVKDGDLRARGLFRRHYSCYHYKDGRKPIKFMGPGEYMVLLTLGSDALFAWRKFIDASGQQGINCSIFRNESNILSSLLIQEADGLAWQRWPEERHYTYVNPNKIISTNPGYCFIQAGWNRCGFTQKGLVILERINPNAQCLARTQGK